MFWLRYLVLPPLFLLSRADYFIDDANTTSVLFTPASPQSAWAPFYPGSPWFLSAPNGSADILDYNRVYNKTLRSADCNSTSNCQMEIQFTGSGITLFGVMIAPITNDFTIAIDGKDGPAAPILVPPGNVSSPATYNFTLYDVQNLSLSFHLLRLSLVSSNLLFDYAYVNEAPPPVTTSSVPSSTSTSTPTSPVPVSTTSHHSKTSIAVGGAIGGLVALTLVFILAILLLRYRRRNGAHPATAFIQDEVPRHPQMPKTDIFDAPLPHPVPQPPMAHAYPSFPPNTSAAYSEPFHNNIARESHSVFPAGNDSSFPSRSPDLNLVEISNESAALPEGSQRLTDNQLDFLHKLYKGQVPADAIVRLSQRMIGENATAAEGSLRRGSSVMTTAPPLYSQ
jgi:hypothetical protein